MRRMILAAALVVAAFASLTACKKAGIETTPAPTITAETPAAPTEPVRETEVTDGFKTETPAAPIAVEESIDQLNASGVLKTVYFDYDSSDLSTEARSTLQRNAEWLNRNASRVVEIGGHCDERGSIEYNLALGDRRAKMVASYLSDLGVNGARLEAVSYGEEKPVDRGHGEEAWSKNRRADFRIKS